MIKIDFTKRLLPMLDLSLTLMIIFFLGIAVESKVHEEKLKKEEKIIEKIKGNKENVKRLVSEFEFFTVILSSKKGLFINGKLLNKEFNKYSKKETLIKIIRKIHKRNKGEKRLFLLFGYDETTLFFDFIELESLITELKKKIFEDFKTIIVLNIKEKGEVYLEKEKK